MLTPCLRRVFRPVIVIFILSILTTSTNVAAEKASPNDTARFLAGLAPSSGSPLEILAETPAWKQYAETFNTVWSKVEERQLDPIRNWRNAHLKTPQKTMYYMFSGPDFVYANTVYPGAQTYILSGLERIGPLPDLSDINPDKLGVTLDHLWGSLDTILNWSYFITRDMQSRFSRADLAGNLPVLYVFLARTGKTILDVSFVELDREGREKPRAEKTPKGAPVGVKILFKGDDGTPRTLYYFRTDLVDKSVRNTGFLTFCKTFGTGDALVKSASYLLHYGTFSEVRNFLLANSSTIVQDDSGIALRFFPREQWNLRTFGNYVGPIPIFKKLFQKDLETLFKEHGSNPVPFGMGYRYRPNQTNILHATRMTH